MVESISDRANALFKQARADTTMGIRRVSAERNQVGGLYSGATIKRFVEVHGDASRRALAEAIDSIGRRRDSRGFLWRRMIEDVRRELDKHIVAAEQSVSGELLKIASEGPKLAEPLLAAVREQLNRDLGDYREGWTGIPGRPWSERHKVFYAILLAAGGAAVSKIVEMAIALGK